MVDQRSHLFSYSIFDRKQFLQLTTNLIKIRFPGAVVEDRMTNGSSKTSLFLGRALSDYSARDSSSIFYPPRATSTKDSVEDLTASGSPTVDQRKGEPEA